MAKGKPSQSSTQKKQTFEPQMNLFPMGAIKNTKPAAPNATPSVKQAVGKTKQPNISPPPKVTSKIDGRDYAGKPGTKGYEQ